MLFLLLLLLPLSIFAQEVSLSDIDIYSAIVYDHDPIYPLSIKGYIYQGYSKSLNNNYNGESSSNLGSFKDTDIGLMASYTVNDYIDVRGFIKYEKKGVRLNEISVSYALADIHTTFDSNIIGLRLGEVRNDFGLYSSTMDDPTTRDMDVLPHSLYRPIWSNIIKSGTGFQSYLVYSDVPFLHIKIDYAIVNLKFIPKKDMVFAWFSIPMGGEFESKSKDKNLSIILLTKDLKWLLRYDYHDITANYITDGSILPSGNYGSVIKVIGLKRYFDYFDISYEVMTASPKANGWAFIPGALQSNSISYNYIVRYTPNETWTYLLGYNLWSLDSADHTGVGMSKSYRLPPATFYYKDLNIGVKYKYSNNIIFKASYHNIKGYSGISPIDNPNLIQNNKEVDKLLTLSVTYVF